MTAIVSCATPTRACYFSFQVVERPLGRGDRLLCSAARRNHELAPLSCWVRDRCILQIDRVLGVSNRGSSQPNRRDRMVWMDELSVRCVSDAMDISRIFWIGEAHRRNIWFPDVVHSDVKLLHVRRMFVIPFQSRVQRCIVQYDCTLHIF